MDHNPDNLKIVETSHIPRTWVASDGPSRARSTEQRLRSALGALAFIRRRWIALIIALAVGLVCVVALLAVTPKTYEADASVLIVAANVGRDPSVTSVDLPSLATSSELLARVKQKLNLSLDPAQLKQNVRASVRTKSSIMVVDYRDKVPDRAVTVPNAVADELVSYYDNISSRGADVTIHKLDRAIADVQHRLHKIDDAIAAQAKLHPFVQSDNALGDVTSRLDDLTKQEKDAEAGLSADLAQRDAIAADPEIQHKVVRYEKLQNDPMYRGLAASIAADEAQLAVYRTTLTEQHPTVRALEKKLSAEHAMSTAHVSRTLSAPDSYSSSEAASAIAIQKADAVVAGDRAKLSEINGLIASTKMRLNDSLNAGVFGERLRLQHDGAKADYLALMARRAAAVASRAESLSLGSLVVVDRAERSDTKVVGLGQKALGFMMAIVALAIAVTVAFIVDSLDRRINRPDQIERLYGLPLIALIDADS